MSTKNFFFLGLFAFALIGFSACESDPCKDKDCGTGDCDVADGTCLCDAGYEYDAAGSCKVVTEHKFVATWNVTDVCATAPNPTTIAYPAIIGHGTSETDLKISFTGFAGTSAQGGFGKAVEATVSGTTITIARQNPDGTEPTGEKFFVSGTGTIDATVTPAVMKITYKFEEEKTGSPTGFVNCVATYKKQ
jgi:hypothetical protein